MSDVEKRRQLLKRLAKEVGSKREREEAFKLLRQVNAIAINDPVWGEFAARVRTH